MSVGREVREKEGKRIYEVRGVLCCSLQKAGKLLVDDVRWTESRWDNHRCGSNNPAHYRDRKNLP
ncbi:MAG: hypothetical protein ABIM21_01150 [candidate division WOR-3 bacterium]